MTAQLFADVQEIGFCYLTTGKDQNWDLPFQIYTDIPFP